MLIKKAVRYSHNERVLWVDAVCINQTDDSEKSHQVTMMSEIYSYTQRCLAWLGDFEEDAIQSSDASVIAGKSDTQHLTSQQNSQNFSTPKVRLPKAEVQRAFDMIDKMASRDEDGHFTIDEGDPPPGWVKMVECEVNALLLLMDLDWWKRIWTVQETILPPRLVLICGGLEREDAINDIATKNVGSHGVSFNCCSDLGRMGQSVRLLLAELSFKIIGPRQFRASDILHVHIVHFRTRQCCDPRDKVFALVGLTYPTMQQMVNYTWTKREVYIRFIRCDIISTNSLGALARVNEFDRDLSLPSWVPDLQAAVDLVADPSQQAHIAVGYTLYDAARNRNLHVDISREDELRIYGIKADSIKSVSGEAGRTKKGGYSPQPLELTALWRGMVERDSSLEFDSYPGGGDYSEAFWRTCTSDILADSRNWRRIQLSDEETMKQRMETAFGQGVTTRSTFFVTENGLLGIGPAETRVGDTVHVLFGGNMPFLLREIQDGDRRGCYNYVGHAYVHGIMDGQAVQADVAGTRVTIV